MRTWIIGAAVVGAAATVPGPATSVEPQPAVTIEAATYNVCKVNCSGQRSWDERRTKVVRTISAADADLLAVQEAPTLPWRGTTQWADLSGLLASAGYQQTSDQDGCSENCTRGAHLYFRPDRIRNFPLMVPSGQPEPPAACMPYLNNPALPEDKSGPQFRDWRRYACRDHLDYSPTVDRSVGMASQRSISGTSWPGIQDRNVSWAYLQEISTGGVFLAVSVHLPNENTETGERVRRSFASAFPDWISALNAERGLSGVPVMVLGDLNSYSARQPRGAHWLLAQGGYRDAFSADRRINEHFGTINVTPKLRKWHGFPPKPHRYADTATRLDYIFTTNGIVPLTHEVVLHLEKGGFDPAYQGSDHNLVKATLSVPVVTIP